MLLLNEPTTPICGKESDHGETHCEAAEEDDYGPTTTCERWDLWYLPDIPATEELKPGGEVIRGKAAWWQKNI